VQIYSCLSGIKVSGFAPIGMMECWNNGIMGSGIMQCWIDGKICVDDKTKMDLSKKDNNPVFQHSTIPWSGPDRRP